MKKHLRINLLGLLSLLLVASCTPFDELETDPNRATSAPSSLLLAGVLKDMTEGDNAPWDDAQRDNQFWVISFDYYGDQDYNWGAANFKYNVLSNVEAMIKETQALDTKNKYEAIGKFLKAYYFDYMSKRLGDVPLSEALQAVGENNIQKPKYDSQRSVYVQILEWLEEANTQIAEAQKEIGTGDVQGDFFYTGDLTKWQKAINSFHLRVLINLSKKAADLDVANRFQKIISDPATYPLLESNADNMKRVYGNEQNNFYTWNPGNRGFNRNRNIMGATYLNLLKDREDPRIYVVADPAESLYDENNPKSLDAYVGAETGAEQGPMQVASDNGMLSYPSNKRYYSDYTGQPNILLSYAEQEFTIAEAANRKWINANAEEHYLKGIKASMNIYDIQQEDINSYIAQSSVVYKGDNTQGLEQILTQKYIAFFNNSGRESYFNYRRTGIPTFDIGPANKNGGKIPMRWKYPQQEYQNNEENVKAAIDSQFNGTDDINAKMWLIK